MSIPGICMAACLLAGGSMAGAQQAPDAAAGQPDATAAAKEPAVAMADIKRALRTAEDVPAAAISVNVHADTVVLTGEVESELQAARALAVAQQQAGGVRVSSHVEVRPGQQAIETRAAASAVVREVEQALRQDRRTANLGVAVTIDDEEVIGLHGLVPSRESRAAAEEVAARVDGVKRVSSRLVVPGE